MILGVRQRKVIYNGKKYKTMSDFCREYGLVHSVFMRRWKEHEFAMDQVGAVLDEIKHEKEKCVKDHKGNEFKNYSEMAKHYGIKSSTLRNRLAKGLNIEQALCDSDMRK